MITITAFDHSPDGGKGLARDTRVRWALEEVGLPYQVRGVTFEALKQPAHMALQPFGQIPTFEEDGLVLFETGSIILHLAQKHPGLLPQDPNARARAISWMFASVNTIEPPILDMATARLFERDKPWAEARMPLVVERLKKPLTQLSNWLADSEWLEGTFTAGDLMMVHVILRLKPSGFLNEFPSLAAYAARGEARPAYQKAYAAQLEFNTRKI